MLASITWRLRAAALAIRQSGAALVEFAIVVPLLLIMMFGVMEAGWAFSQSVEIRNAAREGGRLAVVDYGTASEIAIEVCNRAGISGPGTVVTVTRLPADGPPFQSIEVTVAKSFQSLTGLFPMFNGTNLTSTVEMRIERDLANLVADGTGTCL